jgi:hypothetical protein
MALVSRKEFAVIAGLGYKVLNVYIGRGKIVPSGDYIDTLFVPNADFLRGKGIDPENITLANAPVAEKKKVVEPAVDQRKYADPVIKEPKAIENKREFRLPELKSTYGLEAEKKALEVEKLKKENRILKAKAEKLEGELIPTELVKALIRELSEAMKISYMEALETYTVIVGAQKKLTSIEMSNIKRHFTGLINDTLIKQVDIAKKMLSNIVNEYSQTKGRGERE